MRPSSRKGSTALVLLRFLQIGLSLRDLDEITVGAALDIYFERINDSAEWTEEATQEDIDAF